jgi:polyphosphate glucokinase
MITNRIAKENQEIVLGIDIGGTGIKAALVNTVNGKLLGQVLRMPTPQPATPKAVVNVIREIIAHFCWRGDVGCGFPGVVKEGITLSAANVAKEWVNFPFQAELETMVNAPVVVINDADAAGLAEMKFGAGKPYYGHGGGTVLMLTLGTGIGSALFVDGHLVPNTELGHLELQGVDAEKMAAASIKTRENLSWEVWAERLNLFLQQVEFLLSPDVFIIGGGISSEYQKFFPLLQVHATLLPANMGNDAGIIGAGLRCALRM